MEVEVGGVISISAWRVAPELGRLVYDDYDMTAYALRGLNASLGRTAGRTDDPPYLGREQFNALLSEETSQTPLRDSYFLEYPHAALLIFRLGYWLAPLPEGVHPPAAVCDGSHRDVVEHRPENERGSCCGADSGASFESTLSS